MPEESSLQGPEESLAPPLLEPDPDATEAFALVHYFYERFHHVPKVTPLAKELEQARKLIAECGLEQARYNVDFAYQVAPETKYQPQVFGGILSYADRALDNYQKKERVHQQEQKKRQLAQAEEQGLREERERRAQLTQRYQALSPEEQARLQEQAKANLMQRSYKPEMMFAAVVNSEIYRLMETQEITST